jgi:hypothetical protein
LSQTICPARVKGRPGGVSLKIKIIDRSGSRMGDLQNDCC